MTSWAVRKGNLNLLLLQETRFSLFMVQIHINIYIFTIIIFFIFIWMLLGLFHVVYIIYLSVSFIYHLLSIIYYFFFYLFISFLFFFSLFLLLYSFLYLAGLHSQLQHSIFVAPLPVVCWFFGALDEWWCGGGVDRSCIIEIIICTLINIVPYYYLYY